MRWLAGTNALFIVVVATFLLFVSAGATAPKLRSDATHTAATATAAAVIVNLNNAIATSAAANKTATAVANVNATKATSAANKTATAGAQASRGEAAPTGTSTSLSAHPTIHMLDIVYSPQIITIPANTMVNITLVNDGVTDHDFNIEMLGVHSGNVQPGKQISFVVEAVPGTYRITCSIPGHEAAGMSATLIVK